VQSAVITSVIAARDLDESDRRERWQ